MPGRKRLRTAFPALEDTPERHREPRRDRPHRARSTGPHAIRAQAAHVKVAEKTSMSEAGRYLAGCGAELRRFRSTWNPQTELDGASRLTPGTDRELLIPAGALPPGQHRHCRTSMR